MAKLLWAVLSRYFWESLFFKHADLISQCDTFRCKSKDIWICDISQFVQKQYVVKKLCLIFLKECHNTKQANAVIAAHVEMLISDFNERFHDLKAIEFPSWSTQPLLVDLSAVSEQWQREIRELQDEIVKTFFKIKAATMCLSEKCEKKYPHSSISARQKVISFPSSCSVESGFIFVAGLLYAGRNQLEITTRDDLSLKLTKMEPRIKNICNKDQAQSSHLTMLSSMA